jgi:hypothetical protein
MYRFFKFILGTGLVVTSLWSCSLDDAAPVLSINAVDPIPMAKEFYTQEKPKQVSSSFRIQAEQEIFPFWVGAKSHADGRILIVPAHRKVQVRYEAGYLRRFVFELDERGQVIRGGMLELAGKDSEFLLQNEVLLVEGFLAGVKSKDLTYLWSDFVSRPLDGTQADGRVVALQREGGGKSRLDAEALRTEFCIDWYWVYSFNGVVVFEVYSHTTCGSASCDSARTANAQDACLDDGIGGGGSPASSEGADIISYIEKQYRITLTNCEKEWIYEFTYLAYSIWRNREKAFRETESTFGKNMAKDCSDAFRHAYWSALNYRDVGVLAAFTLGAAHECNTPEGIDRSMDFHNNEVGFSISSNVSSGTDLELKNAVLNSMNNGELLIFNYNENGLITSENCL